MNKETLEVIQQLLMESDTLKPIVSEVVDLFLKDYAPEMGKLTESLRTAVIKSTDQTVKDYQELGYSKEEAIAFTMNHKEQVVQAINNMKKK